MREGDVFHLTFNGGEALAKKTKNLSEGLRGDYVSRVFLSRVEKGYAPDTTKRKFLVPKEFME